MNEDKSGYIYILSNPAMPGILKIGRSINGGMHRATELYKNGGTGVPMPFKLEFEIFSPSHSVCELEVHKRFDGDRINKSREFFRLDVEEAIITIMDVVGSFYNLTTGLADLTVSESQLNESYGILFDEINRVWPGIPPIILLAQAIGYHLDSKSILNAVVKYKDSCEKRRKIREFNKENRGL
jgi:hypothetical protein